MKYLTALLIVALLAAGCGGGGKQVTRLDPNTQTDLSGRWNDTDSRLVAEEMTADCLSRPWLVDFLSANSAKPVVLYSKLQTEEFEPSFWKKASCCRRESD